MGERLDIELVSRGLAETRSKAQNMIKNSAVSVNGLIVTKPAFLVNKSDEIKIVGETLKYVGKGGLKLEKAISEFKKLALTLVLQQEALPTVCFKMARNMFMQLM